MRRPPHYRSSGQDPRYLLVDQHQAMRKPPEESCSGFTLIELSVTVSVLAILAAVAAPAFKDLLASQRVRSAAAYIISDLTLARSEALKRGVDVILSPVGDLWTNGWSVTVASSAEILSAQGSLGQGVGITTAPSIVRFDRNGRLNTTSVVRFQLSNGNSSKRCISLDPSGRPKSALAECPS